jgi:prepilin-type processing-associated H-X9-DG protein
MYDVEVCLVVLLFLALLPVLRAVQCVHRLVNPEARGGRGAARELLGCLGVLVACALAIALITPALPLRAGEAARNSCCRYNLKQIGIGMGNYFNTYHSYPPAYSADASDCPLQSWRVLLLPFVEQQALHRQLRLNEPWDSPHNVQVFAPAGASDKHEIREFRCPSDPERGALTNYVMILGPRTLSNGPNSVRPTEITDGASNTIAVVETYGLGIRWYEPRDLRVDEMSFKINDPEHFGIASHHPGGANVGFADGSVRLVPDSTDSRAIEAATTINGGEDLPSP